jgi:hypothetical protein
MPAQVDSGLASGALARWAKLASGMHFHDAVPGVPYPPIDLEDLGSQTEGLAGDALVCQAEAERGG